MMRALSIVLLVSAAHAAPLQPGLYDGLVLGTRADIGWVSGVLSAGAARCVFTGRIQPDGAARIRMSDAKGDFVGRLEAYKGGFRLLHDREGATCPPAKGPLRAAKPYREVRLAGPKGATIMAMPDEEIVAKLGPNTIAARGGSGRWETPKGPLKAGILAEGWVEAPRLAAARGAMSFGDLTRALGEFSPEADPKRVDAWSQDGRYFGTCSWLCASRNEAHERTCSIGPVTADGVAKLVPISAVDWPAYNFVRARSASTAKLAGLELKGGGSLNDDTGVGAWAVRSAVDSVAVSSGSVSDAYEAPQPLISVSPSGLAVVAESSGDHGCGEQSGVVMGTEAVAERWVKAGLKQHLKGKPAAALPFYKRAMAIAPAYRKAQYNAACAHGLLGHAEAAADLMKALIAADSQHYVKRLSTDSDFKKVLGSAPIQALLKAQRD